MSRRVAIRGLGLVSGHGLGAAALAQGLAGNARPGTADTAPLSGYLPPARLRRADHFCRLALLAACQALAAAGLPPGQLADMGLVLATGYGPVATTFSYLDSILDAGPGLCSPTAFSLSVHNAATSTLSILLGARGPALTVSQFASSTASALASAWTWLQEGRCGRLLFGAVDEGSELLEGLIDQAAGDAPDRGPALEGAACLLLDTDESDAACPRLTRVAVDRAEALLATLPAGTPLVLGPGALAAEGLTLPESSPRAALPGLGRLPVAAGLGLGLAVHLVHAGRLLPELFTPASDSARRLAWLDLAPAGSATLALIEAGP